MLYLNTIYLVLIGLALFSVGRSIYDYKNSSVGILLIYLLNGVLLLGLIRLFFTLVDFDVIKIDESTLMVIWHLMFYFAIGLFLIATRILVKTISVIEYKESLPRALLIFAFSIGFFGLLFLMAVPLDKFVIVSIKDSYLDHSGLMHFIAFIFAGFVSFYLLQIHNKYEGNIKSIAFPLLFSVGFLSLIHFWELLTESWKLIHLEDEMIEDVEKYLWIPVFLMVVYAFRKFRGDFKNQFSISPVPKFSLFNWQTNKDKPGAVASVADVVPSIELETISYLQSLVNKKESISEILKFFEEAKSLPSLEREKVYIKTYYALENFISQNKPPIVKRAFTKEEIRQEIRINLDIFKAQLSFKLIFLLESQQRLALFELSIRDFVSQILVKLGRARLQKVLSSEANSTLQQVFVTERGLDFGKIYERINQVDTGELFVLLKSFYTALHQEIIHSFGKKLASDLIDKNYVFVKASYEYELVARFLFMMPEGILELERVAYLTREELEQRAIKTAEEKTKRKIAEETAQEMKSNIEELGKTKDAMLNILEDLDDSKNRAEKLAHDLAKFKLAVDSTSEMVVIADPEGVVLYGNKAVEKITGYKVQEAMGKKAGTLWSTPMPKEYYQNLWHTIKDEKKIFVGEIQNKKKHGETYTAEITISPVLNEKGDIIFMVGIERDVTKEREVDKAKTEFVSLASHQLRTPLTAVKWYSEMLLSGDLGKMNAKQKKYLNDIHHGNERMVELVNALLNVSRLELGTFVIEPVETDIVKLAREMIDEQQSQIVAKKIKFSSAFEKDIPLIQADPKLLGMVIQNLLSNAVKYTPDGGTVSFSLSIDKRENNIVCQVTDSGYGIPLDQQSKIFTKLFRADNIKAKDVDGTGLGLYIVKSVVEKTGGKIWFESEENKGSTFFVSLPIAGVGATKEVETVGIDTKK